MCRSHLVNGNRITRPLKLLWRNGDSTWQSDLLGVNGPAAGVEWRPGPAVLSLADDEVHVWRAWLECPPLELSHYASTLSKSEQRRAHRLHLERDRRRFVIGRGILRAILGRYLGVDAGAIKFCYSAAGKPALSTEFDETLRFNVTHADSLALYAVGHSEVGVDVEHVREINEAEQIANRFFTAGERTELRAVPRAKRMETFLRVWTRKEAYLKACGIGIAEIANRVEVSLHDEATCFQVGTGNIVNSSRWSLHDLTPAPGYLAALANRGATPRLSWFNWQGLKAITGADPAGRNASVNTDTDAWLKWGQEQGLLADANG